MKYKKKGGISEMKKRKEKKKERYDITKADKRKNEKKIFLHFLT